MYRPHRMQRRISLLVSLIFFVIIFPYTIIGDMYIPPVYAVFCVILNGLSAALFGFMLYKVLIRNFPVDDFSTYFWGLAIQSFCHAVFSVMNWGSWVCIGISVAAAIVMLAVYMKQMRRLAKEETTSGE